MLRTSASQPFATLDFLHHAAIFDFPHRRAFLNVLQLAAHLSFDLVVLGELAPQRIAHLATQHEVFSEDLLDVRRVHQHLDQLIQEVVDGVFAELDLALFGDELANAVVVRLGQAARRKHALGLLAHFLLVSDVLIEHGLNVESDLLRGVTLDVASRKKRTDHFGRNLGHLRAVKPHAPLLSYFERDLSRFRRRFRPARRILRAAPARVAQTKQITATGPRGSLAEADEKPPDADAACRRRGWLRRSRWPPRSRRRAPETHTACTRSGPNSRSQAGPVPSGEWALGPGRPSRTESRGRSGR